MTPKLDQHGTSLRPLLENHGGRREFALNEWELLPARTGVALSLNTVRTRTHKLTLEMRSEAGELYDLEHDPDEMDNVFDQPSTKTVRRKLEALIQSRPDDMRPVQSPVGMA